MCRPTILCKTTHSFVFDKLRRAFPSNSGFAPDFKTSSSDRCGDGMRGS